MGRSDTGNGKDASGEDAGNAWPRVLADILKDIPKLLKSNAVACFAQATNLCRLTCIRRLAGYKTSQLPIIELFLLARSAVEILPMPFD